MEAYLQWHDASYAIDFSSPTDLSLPLGFDRQPNAFDLPEAEVFPFRTEGFTGIVAEGGSCNVDGMTLYPHGNGTHTECIGHIDSRHTFLDAQHGFPFQRPCALVSAQVEGEAGLHRLAEVLEEVLETYPRLEALALRTYPNPPTKRIRHYGGQHPPAMSQEGMRRIAGSSVRHLLVDLPSVDPEDDTELFNHHLFWNYPHAPIYDRTITEMIYVPDTVPDGLYWLCLTPLVVRSDASPSRPVLYPMRLR